MPKAPRLSLARRELFWLAPFTFLAAATIALSRSPPALPRPAQSRVVTDAEGEKIAVPLPFRTIAGSDFLEVTHAPEALFKAGGPRDRIRFSKGLIGRFYPEILKNDSLWDAPGDVESLLAHADGVIFVTGRHPASWRRVGIPALTTAIDSKNPNERVAAVVHITNAALGHEEHGEAILTDYELAYRDLKQELKPETLTRLPRVLPMGCWARDWGNVWVFNAESPPYDDRVVGVENATTGYRDIGRQQEAERILAMNPDFIFVAGESVDEFLQDPRWQGLEAVSSKRVYGGGSGFRPGIPTWNLDSRPLGARLMAEIVHPDRLQPRMRGLTRDHFLKAYGYRLSEEEIDEILGVEAQKNSTGYARFERVGRADVGASDHLREPPQ